MSAIASAGAMAGGALGAMLGAAEGGFTVSKVYNTVDKIFGAPDFRASRSVAEQTLCEGVIEEVYEVDQWTGQVRVYHREGKLTGNEASMVLHEKARNLSTSWMRLGTLAWMELAVLCLSIEVIRQVR